MTTATQDKAQALARTVRSTSLLPREPLTQKDIDDASIPTLHRAMVLRTPKALAVSRALAAINGRPLGDRILVLPLPRNQRFGSVIIPENAQEDQTCGIVVSVGAGRYEGSVLIPPSVAPGNYVVFSKYSSRSIDVAEIELMQISEQDVLFVAGTE